MTRGSVRGALSGGIARKLVGEAAKSLDGQGNHLAPAGRTEERERRRLAGDLHDGLSQTMSLVQMKLASLRSAAEPALQATTSWRRRTQSSPSTSTSAPPIHAERVRSMTLESLVAEEDERRSLASQLQNGLGQDIALAKMGLASLRDSTSARLQEALLGIERLVEHADRSFRSITFQISPLILYDLGLMPAIEWLAEDVRERFGCELQIADEFQVEPTGDTLRVIVFRVVRELVIREARHGGPGQSVLLRHHGDEAQLRVTIQCGQFWLKAGSEGPAGDGLFNLREQLRHVRATLRVDPVAGRGTTVTLTAPLAG